MLLELLIVGFWLSFATYCSWYFFKAKTFQPLTLDDLDLANAQTTNKLHSIPPPKPTHKKQRGRGIQMRMRLRVPAKTLNNAESPQTTRF
jgi:hypothetical protein